MTAITAGMNASRFNDNDDDVGRPNGSFNSTRGWEPQDTLVNWTTVIAVRDVIWYLALALGIPGNILSAIVWLRVRHDVASSSSVIYLAVLAIVNLEHLLIRFFCLDVIRSRSHVLWLGASYLAGSAGILEPLLLSSFSVERLIAVLRPLQVRLIRVIIYTYSH